MEKIRGILLVLSLVVMVFTSISFERWVKSDPDTRLRHISGFSFGIGMTALIIGYYIGMLD
ncbi:MAG: hypothetical protein D6726_03790 [Nitrospirae bacterium]|nr:MAG: hypothetical protein D6726_03790 [Nitrospirota bacterium]